MKEIYSIIGLKEKQTWMMAPKERLAILGLLSVLKPQIVLELGFAEGGCTEYLSKYSKIVYTVDMDKKVLLAPKSMKNVKAFNMKTDEAFELFKSDNLQFNLCIIDADHSIKGALRDLKSAISMSDIIIMHDTSNPKCRKGYLKALKKSNVFYDLDFVEGQLKSDGLWGGLGIVIPKKVKPKSAQKIYGNFFYMKIKFYLTIFWSLKFKSIVRNINYLIHRIKLKIN